VDHLAAKGAKGYPYNENDVNSIAEALKGADLVVSTLGMPAITGGVEKRIIEAAALTGTVKRFVTSNWGAQLQATNPVTQAKQYAATYAAEKGLEHTGFITGTWLEYVVGPFFGFDLEKFSAYVPNGGDFYFSVTSLHDVAKVASYAVHHPSSKNAIVPIAANTLTWNHFLSILERVRAIPTSFSA
jgi:uncharacterized protein YbjT (DUF2867 family)